MDPSKHRRAYALQLFRAQLSEGEQVGKNAWAMAVAVASAVPEAEQEELVREVWGERKQWGEKLLRNAIKDAERGAKESSSQEQRSCLRKRALLLKRVRSAYEGNREQQRKPSDAQLAAAVTGMRELREEVHRRAPPPCECEHRHCRAVDAWPCRFMAAEGTELAVPCVSGGGHELAEETCRCPHRHCSRCGAALPVDERALIRLQNRISPLLDEVVEVSDWICVHCDREE